MPFTIRPMTAAIAAGIAMIALPFLAAPAASQWEDTGTFEVTVDRRPAGTEEFSIRQAGVGETAETTAVGRVRLRLATGTLDIDSRLRASGVGARPVAYQVEIGGDAPRTIVGTVGGGRFTARIQTPTGEQMREYVASEGAVVLDDGVAHHYRFAAERRAEGRIPIIIPRENRQAMAEISDRGSEAIQIGDRTIQARRLVLRGDRLSERHFWIDGANRVLRVEIPEHGYVAVRTAVPE